jgi:AcrR family transcriptional regulator
MPDVKTRRRYNNAGRAAAAAHTRRSITEAARSLFVAQGYAATTMTAIAEEAGVAWQTVYSAFGTKAAVLSAVWDIAVVGDDEPVPVAEREISKTAMAEPDARDVLAGFARFAVPSAARTAPVVAVLEQAAPAHPEIADLLATVKAQRLAGMTRLATALAERHALADGLTIGRAADILYSLLAAIPALLERGWAKPEVQDWLTEAFTRLLFQSGGGPGRRQRRSASRRRGPAAGSADHE